jgi:hypothetical protein
MATNTLLIVHAGLVLVIPYGMLSEKIGGRSVAALNLFGYALSSVWIIVVCESNIKVQRANHLYLRSLFGRFFLADFPHPCHCGVTNAEGSGRRSTCVVRCHISYRS